MIIEESGIAKGIRRIVAVTGYDAQEVTRFAKALQDKLTSIEQLSGKEKDTALKAYTVVSADITSRLGAILIYIVRNWAKPRYLF